MEVFFEIFGVQRFLHLVDYLYILHVLIVITKNENLQNSQ